MRLPSKRQRIALFAAGAALSPAILAALAWLAPRQRSVALALAFREYGTNIQGEPVARIKVQNVSGDYLELMGDATDPSHIQCEYSQRTPAGRTNWIPALQRIKRHLGPGEALVANIRLPTNAAPVNVAILARGIPYIRGTGSPVTDMLNISLSTLRIRLASRRSYQPYWLDEPLVLTNPAPSN